jgi:hypothetical protein
MKDAFPTLYDGPLLNGHPPLSIADVQTWFKIANCTIAQDHARTIAQLLNEYELLGAIWRNAPALRAQRRSNTSTIRNRRIAKSLISLQSDLGGMLKDVRRLVPKSRFQEFQPAVDLLTLVEQTTPYFRQHLPRRGREADLWHVIAKKVGSEIVLAFKSSGRRTGLGKPTSPAIKVLQRALAYLDLEVSPEAIVDAVRPKRVRKRGEIRPPNPQTTRPK